MTTILNFVRLFIKMLVPFSYILIITVAHELINHRRGDTADIVSFYVLTLL